MEQSSAAWKSENWDDAITATLQQMNYEGNVDVNKAGDYLALGLLYFNTDNKSGAYEMIEKAIEVMKRSRNLGNGCEVRTETFLKKVKRMSSIPTFTYKDTCKGGIYDYLMEIPNAVFHKKMDATIARYQALSQIFGSMTQSYRQQGRVQASMAKFYASSEYQKKTGRTFDPDSRPSGGNAREEWETCKKIYDIFGE